MEIDKKSIDREKYAEIAKNSLIRVQYSCSGNNCDVESSDIEENTDENTSAECETENV